MFLLSYLCVYRLFFYFRLQILSRLLSGCVLILMLVLSSAVVGVPAATAGESDDAKVAFGAFADGLYDFAGLELEQFLEHYPKSKMAPRARLVLVLCSLLCITVQ